jgi:hypothetical protein
VNAFTELLSSLTDQMQQWPETMKQCTANEASIMPDVEILTGLTLPNGLTGIRSRNINP